MTRAEQILAKMPEGIYTIQELKKHFDIADSQLRQILKGLAEDGLMEKVELHEQGAQGAPRTVGWQKLPHHKKTHSGMHGGLAKADTTPGQHRKDMAEVRAYRKSHPGATARDVAMECNMTNNHAERLIREDKE